MCHLLKQNKRLLYNAKSSPKIELRETTWNVTYFTYMKWLELRSLGVLELETLNDRVKS